jgi:hypothetical protein
VADAFNAHRNRLAAGGLFPNWALYYIPSSLSEYGGLAILRRDDDTPRELFRHACDVPPAIANGTRDAFRAWLRREAGMLPILKREAPE